MKAPRVTLEQWRALQAVVDKGGFAQAAEALHKSQSSISYTVAKLQEQLGYPLLIIEGRKAQLTERGEVLLRRSRHLLKEAIDLEELAHTLGQGWEPEIELVVDEAFPTPALLRAFQEFEPQSQGTLVQLKEVVLSGAEEELKNGSPDLVLTSLVPKGYLADPIVDVEMVAVAAPSHVLHREKEPINNERLARELQVVIRDSATETSQDAGWLGSNRRWTVSGVQSAIEIVATGIGFAWLPKADLHGFIKDEKLVPLNLVSGTERKFQMYAIFGKGERTGPATRLFVELLQHSCQRCPKAL
ncbi:LysR family transcriptional regulator [Marinomonas mediterranea]|jgi:Transcriptional regulator|uniref:Transcriptional regulator, LysR family n=1 Tax=Marinomonas mediterranea (strain ATCC 700492 / JCM 21426 / NBRC 103028 / MMB-1) TaxID=717774 RepID=F2K139_MARM1|nr:LysR family transcriptional regulator [Marinomonas mediterranea]ADZ89889.1 transcriptional regulator, LysR family [Marinomonas mediterranea MMB-1]WCN07974.1 LysR family transcriptional regulator [Marinomonas mediterranea]WCN12069.1 LysR family transcriptional regulator [Marinomonas mediterranea]WCN16107.1 LysR family transcriptional regulator [Marinomonas mediterranea MMB-1]